MTKSVEIASNSPVDRTAADRIEEGAERVKQATSHAVAGTKEAVDRAADRVEEGLHHATDQRGRGVCHHAHRGRFVHRDPGAGFRAYRLPDVTAMTYRFPRILP